MYILYVEYIYRLFIGIILYVKVVFYMYNVYVFILYSRMNYVKKYINSCLY